MNCSRVGQSNCLTFRINSRPQACVLNSTTTTSLGVGNLNRTTSCTTNVESTHCQLRTRLTNRLRSNNTCRSTEFDFFASRQVFAVTNSTNAYWSFTSQNRAHANFRVAHIFYAFSSVGRNDFAFTNNQFIGHTVTDSIARSASLNNCTQWD